MENTRQKVVTGRRKRLGRGYGSGKGGHTVGRGQKGQGARRSVGILFEGVKNKKSLLHRLPMLPGKGKFKASLKPFPVSLSLISEKHPEGEVTVETLVKNNIIKKSDIKNGVKIVGGTAEISKKFVVRIPVSQSSRLEIEKAHGTVS